jgi:glutamate carboxypeptidase
MGVELRERAMSKRFRIGLLAVGALAMSGLACAAPTAVRPDRPLWAAAQAAQPDALDLLKSVVNIDSGTGDVEGAAKVEEILGARLKALGAEVRAVPGEQKGVGDSLVATFKGTGKGRILIIAHVDTVFGPGTVAKRPFSIADGRAHGPGVGDEKGGDVCAIEALTLLNKLGFKNFGTVTVLLEASEERGSPGARALIASLAKDADVEFNMEPGPPIGDTDGLDVWRKGSEGIVLTVHGRAAHAGMAPQDGRNAATELVHQLTVLDGAFPHSGDGTTVNLTLIKGGDRENIIPEFAQASFNVRFRRSEDFDAVLAKVKASAAQTVVPETTVEVTTNPSFPPFFQDAAGDALFARAKGVYAEIGRRLESHGTGGASESALAQAVGTPALDGMGFVGGDFHTDHEWVDVSLIPARIYLTARLIEELGARPPAKASK